MYTLEERMKAVQLYIESGYSENDVIRTLGYPSPNTLRSWYKEYCSNGELHVASAPKPHYSETQKAEAVAYYAANRTSLTQTCRSLGYPSRYVLRKWILESCPELLDKDTKPCIKDGRLVKYTQEQKQAAVEATLIDGTPDYKVAAQYGVSRATLYNWKQRLLGRDGIVSMKKEIVAVSTNPTKGELKTEITNLQHQIHRLQMERDALEKATELLKKAGGIRFI